MSHYEDMERRFEALRECTCHEGYKCRGLQDPDCWGCELADDLFSAAELLRCADAAINALMKAVPPSGGEK